MSTHGCCSGPLPPENTFLLVLSNARQKMLDRCSPFSLIGLAREWMDFSMSHSSTLRSSPPERHNEGGKRETLTFRNHSIPHCLETFYIGDSNYQNNYELMQQLKTELLDPHRPQRSPKHKGKEGIRHRDHLSGTLPSCTDQKLNTPLQKCVVQMKQ